METTPHTPKPTGQSTDQDFEAVRREMQLSPDEADRRARIEYLRSITGQSKKPTKRGRTALKFLLVVVVAALLTAGVFWYFSKAADKNKHAQQPAAQPSTNTASQQTASTKHYDSTNFNLGLDYPQDWKVTDNGGGKLTVVSPAADFKTPGGSTTSAQVVFMIQTKQTALPGFKKGDGLASRVSKKLAYTKPTPSQRAQTYLTYVANQGTAEGGLDILYVTGDLGYQKNQNVPQKDVVQADPLVSIFFAKCPNGTCAADPTTANTTIADSAWGDSNALVKAAKALLTSLAIN